MSRDTKFTVGDYWLDKRRDGRSPFWQICTYSNDARSVVYRSTKRRSLDEAKEVLRSYDADQRSKAQHQPTTDAQIVPHMMNYLREQGPDIKRQDTIKSSFRAWIGFLMQHQLGTGAAIAAIDKNFVTDFRRWRMKPHSWEIEWGGRMFKHQSQGVTAKTVMRNIEDLRAALHHGEANHRFTAPKVASVDKKLVKRNPRQALDRATLGAIFGYARTDRGFYRELCLMLASGCRPGHAMKFDPDVQWLGEVIDLQPWREDETDKRAAVIPVIQPLEAILKDWKAAPHDPVLSRKRAWRTMRRALGLPQWVEAYCIRTTVATVLDIEGTPGGQISGIIGHLPESRGVARTTSKHYLAYDPYDCARAKDVLTGLFSDIVQRGETWLADHLRTTPKRGKPIGVVKREEETAELRAL